MSKDYSERYIQMGVDGQQHVGIRGPKETLDELQENGLLFKDMNEECRLIGERFFGKEDINICHRSDRYLLCDFDYRNESVFQYFKELIIRYPMCWIKNDYLTEDGERGLWIGRYQNRFLDIQELKWQELTIEEISYMSDFSKTDI